MEHWFGKVAVHPECPQYGNVSQSWSFAHKYYTTSYCEIQDSICLNWEVVPNKILLPGEGIPVRTASVEQIRSQRKFHHQTQGFGGVILYPSSIHPLSMLYHPTIPWKYFLGGVISRSSFDSRRWQGKDGGNALQNGTRPPRNLSPKNSHIPAARGTGGMGKIPPSPKSRTLCIITFMKQNLKQTAAAQAAAATCALSKPATAWDWTKKSSPEL